MSRTAFAALDRDWALLCRSPEAAAALAQWSETPELRCPDFDTLVERIWRANKADADAALRELARRAPTETLAARVVLQALRPGLRNLGRRMALGGAFDDVDHHLVAIAWEVIRTYPADRRPTSVAANILWDVRKRYVRSAAADTHTVPLECAAAEGAAVEPSAENVAIDAEPASLRRAHARLRAAVDAGVISPRSAAVVWRTRIQDYDETQVAAELGVNVRTMQRRRQRAERTLAAAS